LIFRGIDCSASDNCEEIIKKFCLEILKVKIDAANLQARYLGKKDSQNSPILVSFSRYTDKLEIMSSLKSLKNTGFVVHQDLPTNLRKKRNKLVLARKEVLRLCPKASVRVSTMNLFVNNVRFSWCDTGGLLFGDDPGVLKLNELVGADLSGFIASLQKDTLPKDYFRSARSQCPAKVISPLQSTSSKPA